MTKNKDITLLEKVASVLETSNQADIQEVGREFVEWVATAGKSSRTYVWGMGEPLFMIAQQLTSRDLRLRAYRLVTHCDDAKISPSLKKVHEQATALFLQNAALIEDPIQRFNAYLPTEGEVWGSRDFRTAVGTEAVKLVQHFEKGAERIEAYKRARIFAIGDASDRGMIGIANEVQHLPTAKARVDVMYDICCSARERPEKVRRALGGTYLDNVKELPDIESRTSYNLYAFRHFDLPTALKVLAMDTVSTDIDGIKNPELALDQCKKLLHEVPNQHNKGYEAYHSHRLKAVETILKHVASVRDFQKRAHAYGEVARYSDEDSAMKKQAVAGLASDIATISDAVERRQKYYEIARHGGPATEQAMVTGWKKEMEALTPQEQLDFLKNSIDELFASGGKPFREAYQELFEKAVAALPDPEDRVYFCFDVAAKCERYAGHGLQRVVLDGFKQHLHEIPDKKRREEICWSLMDHDREQTMLPDPPLEQAIYAEWHRLHSEAEESNESRRRELLKKIASTPTIPTHG